MKTRGPLLLLLQRAKKSDENAKQTNYGLCVSGMTRKQETKWYAEGSADLQRIST